MTHGEAAHERGTHNMFTGYRPSPALKYPSMGSVVSHEFGPKTICRHTSVFPISPMNLRGLATSALHSLALASVQTRQAEIFRCVI